MKNILPLSADWQVMYAEPRLGPTRGCSAMPLDRRWLPAEVPGDVHLDLMRAGKIDDPFFGRNTDHCRWMEDWDWWYRADVTPPDLAPGQRLHLHFEGLDVFATVFLNGTEVGRHANMFTPLRLDVTEHVRPGANRLEVCLGAPAFPPQFFQDAAVRGSGNFNRLHVRKAQSCHGWNISPRLVTIGIWKPVSWIVAEPVEIDRVWVRTLELGPDAAEVEALVEVRRNAGAPGTVACDLVVAGQARTLAIPCDDAGGRATVRFRIDSPHAWWPHDHGTQALYDWSATLSRDGAILDRQSGRCGLRTSAFIQEPGADGTVSFKLRVNGRDLFLKGMNWTPADAIFARVDRARYAALLHAAKAANINALRVWGGGIYEHEDFYTLCDELGLIVLHDFMYACACYPQDPGFLAEARREADHIVRSLRHHPCICGWFGDNENEDTAAKRLFAPEYRHNPLGQVVLREAVQTHAPGSPYVPTSPYSPEITDANSDLQGDCHLWAHGKSYRDPFYTDLQPRMITEIGHLGMPSREVVESFVSRDRLWPIWHEEYLMHGADCNRRDRTGRYETLWQSIRARGWPDPQDLDELIRMTQQLQAEATEFWIEFYGHQPDCWGIFLWNLADSWPQMSDAYIAYPFAPKPALAAVRDGYARLRR
ncbi:MAG: hypothetical protein KF897_03000 [Opitutaceae bacterium]|nr:hypothetical protein [Opitutaceae bacterium]